MGPKSKFILLITILMNNQNEICILVIKFDDGPVDPLSGHLAIAKKIRT